MSGLISRSLIHLEFIFVHGVRAFASILLRNFAFMFISEIGKTGQPHLKE